MRHALAVAKDAARQLPTRRVYGPPTTVVAGRLRLPVPPPVDVDAIDDAVEEAYGPTLEE